MLINTIVPAIPRIILSNISTSFLMDFCICIFFNCHPKATRPKDLGYANQLNNSPGSFARAGLRMTVEKTCLSLTLHNYIDQFLRNDDDFLNRFPFKELLHVFIR
jgi:hypothetical protein